MHLLVFWTNNFTSESFDWVKYAADFLSDENLLTETRGTHGDKFKYKIWPSWRGCDALHLRISDRYPVRPFSYLVSNWDPFPGSKSDHWPQKEPWLRVKIYLTSKTRHNAAVLKQQDNFIFPFLYLVWILPVFRLSYPISVHFHGLRSLCKTKDSKTPNFIKTV